MGPQALNPLSPIHIGKREIHPTPIIGLWGSKNGLPNMKVKKLEKFQNKMGLRGCKWSSLNAPGTQSPQSHPYWEKGNSSNSHNWPSGVIRMGSPEGQLWELEEFPFSQYGWD